MSERGASRRRMGDAKSATRAQLLDVAERIMFEEGYAAITTRRIATELGVTGQLVHYYFRGMDELFTALVQRGSDLHMAAVEKILASSDPISILWQTHCEPDDARRTFEYLALANHRKEVASVASSHAARVRRLETAAISRVLSERGVDVARFPAAGVALVIAAIARQIGVEAVIGVSEGHSEARVLVDEFLRFLGSRATGEDRSTGVEPAKKQRRTRRRKGE